MEKKMDIISEIYLMTGGKNIANLINEFETNYKYDIRLKYIDAYKDNDGLIIIKVIDEITECPFELKFNEDLGELEFY